jgi:prepilin-type N-terminal cleavage/methylation domain-containing protein
MPVREQKKNHKEQKMRIAPMQKTNLISSKPASAGFTMVEVLIALAVFSIGILAVFAMQTTAINQNAAARMQSEATAVAVHTMERLAVAPFDHDDLSAAPEDNPHQQDVGPYRVEWQVDTPPWGDPVYNGIPVKRIALTVDSANPHARPVTLSFIKGQGL